MRLIRLLLLLIGTVVPLAGACSGGAIGSQQTCQQLTDEYTNAYPAALVCVPSAANQCQQQAQSPSNCDCNGTVQEATRLDAIVAQMTALGCIPEKGPACPCAYLGPVSCVANDAGAGTCTASLRQ